MEKKQALSRRDFFAVCGAGMAALGLSGLSACSNSQSKTKALSISHGNDSELFPVYANSQYQVKDFSYLTKMPNLGLSAENISNHLGLYKAYVEKVNKAEIMMANNEIDEFSMKNLAFSLNGMALHDIYFSNMSTENTKVSKALLSAIENTFSSFENYYKNLVEQALKVEGWSITALNLLNGKIFNYAEDTHSSNFPNYIMPIMVLDVYEHAWVKQFGADAKAKQEYIDVFSKIINWDLVSRRFDAMQILYS
jgi:Fe-Mn family superoxide dismutase